MLGQCHDQPIDQIGSIYRLSSLSKGKADALQFASDFSDMDYSNISIPSSDIQVATYDKQAAPLGDFSSLQTAYSTAPTDRAILVTVLVDG